MCACMCLRICLHVGTDVFKCVCAWMCWIYVWIRVDLYVCTWTCWSKLLVLMESKKNPLYIFFCSSTIYIYPATPYYAHLQCLINKKITTADLSMISIKPHFLLAVIFRYSPRIRLPLADEMAINKLRWERKGGRGEKVIRSSAVENTATKGKGIRKYYLEKKRDGKRKRRKEGGETGEMVKWRS